MINRIERHRAVNIIGARESAVVKQPQCNQHGGREFAVRERDIQILIAACIRRGVLGARKRGESCVNPRKTDGSRYRRPVAGVVVVLDVVGVLEAKPFVWREQREGAEGRAASDHGLVAAEEGHGVDICWCEVEGRGGGIEACYDWLCIYIQKFLVMD